MVNDDIKHTVIMPATRILQSRVGFGKIKEEQIKEAQKEINLMNKIIKEGPFAEEHIEEVEPLIHSLKDADDKVKITDKISLSIMNFKANVGMFGNPNTTKLAAAMLRWIESVEEIDDDVFDVLNGYVLTLKQIYHNDRITEEQVPLILQEMQSACLRYFDKHPELHLTLDIDNNSAFYIDQTAEKSPQTNEDLDDELSDENLVGDDD